MLLRPLRRPYTYLATVCLGLLWVTTACVGPPGVAPTIAAVATRSSVSTGPFVAIPATGSPRAPAETVTPARTATTAPTDSPIASSPTPAVTSKPELLLELVGQAGGESVSLAMQGETVYLGLGLRLVAIDVSDPAAPRAVNQSQPLPGVVRQVVVDGEYAFILSMDSGLSVLSALNTVSLATLGSERLEQPAYGLAVADGFAYVAAGDAGLVVIDVSTPATPRQANTVPTAWPAMAVTVAGGFAYVAERSGIDLSGALEVFDITQPTTPRFADAIDIAYAQAVVVAGDYAYVGTFGLQIVDIADPIHLSLAGSYAWDYGIDDVAITGDHALISSNRYCDVVAVCPRQVTMLDISDPARPVALAQPALPRAAIGAGRGMAVHDGLIYLANEVGLQIGQWPPWEVDGEYLTANRQTDVAVDGEFAYGVDSYQALTIFDIRGPADPQLVARLASLPGSPSQIYVHNGHAIVGLWDAGVAIVDVREPQQPTLAAELPLGGWQPIAVRGEHLFGLDGRGSGMRLAIYHLGQPAAPVELSSLPLAGGDYTVLEVSDHYAFLVSYGLVEVVDLANLKSPRIAGEFRLDSPSQASYPALLVLEPYVCFLRQSLVPPYSVDLLVYEFEAPDGLRLVNSLPLAQGGHALMADKGYVFVLGGGSISVLDIANPAQPRQVGGSDYRGGGVAVVDDHLYVAGGSSGLLVLRLVDVP